MCVLNNSFKIQKQRLTELKGEIEKNTNLVGDFNTPFSAIDKIRQHNQ